MNSRYDVYVISRILCLVLFLSGQSKAAEQLDSDRPEAWAMNYFTSVSLLAGLTPPVNREFGSIEIGAEVDWLPRLGKSEKRVGFNGRKEEDLNKAPIFARPRLTLGLPWNIGLTASYVPPIRVFGVTPHLFALALERPLYVHQPWTFGARLYGQLGQVEGSFTCPGSAASAPPGSNENPFGCERKSSDTATQRYGGLELTGAYRIESAGGLTPYLSVSGNFLDTKFQVKSRTFGARDRTRLLAGTWTFAVSGGAVYPLSERWSLSLGLFYSPLWVQRFPSTESENDALFNARALLTYRWR
jgi:hypothetical protein